MLENPFLYSLAITLIHFIWQGCLVALGLKLTFTLFAKSPQVKYVASAIAMLISLALPILTFLTIYHADYERIINSNELVVNLVNTIAQGNETDFSTNLIEFLPYLSLAWLASIAYLSVKLVFDIHYVKRLTQIDSLPADKPLQHLFAQLTQSMKLWRMPTLLISLKAEIPMAVGWLKPVVLLPVSMLSGLTHAQLEMLLLHELAHIKRHDYLVNFLQTLIEILLFFHPAIRWISTQMRNEREFCSDDIAVAHCCQPIAYARALTETAALCHQHKNHSIPQMALAASGGDLKQRVVRLVDSHCTSSNDFGKWLAGIFVILSIITLFSQPIFKLSAFEDKLTYLPFYSTSQSATNLQKAIPVKEVNLTQAPLAQHLLNDNSKNAIDGIDKNGESLKINPFNYSAQLDKKINTKKDQNTQTQRNDTKLNKLPIKIAQHKIKHVNQNKIQNKQKIQPLQKKQNKKAVINETKPYQQHLDDTFVHSSNEQPSKSATISKKINKVAIVNNVKSEKPVVDEKYIVKNNAQQMALLANNTSLQPTVTSEDNVLSQFNVPVNRYAAQITELAQPYPNVQKKIKKPSLVSAQLINYEPPKYPQIAKRKKIELEVLVHFTVSANGTVSNIEFAPQNKVAFFRRSIRTAMKKWRFNPAQKNGKNVVSKMSKIFSFNLAD